MEVRKLAPLVSLAAILASCNLSDPITGPPVVEDGCESNADCGDFGTCDDGVCSCQDGYVGDACEDCDEGYMRDGDECVVEMSCEGMIVDGECVVVEECDEGQVRSTDGVTCVDDLCAEDPCTGEGQVAGTCTMTSDTETSCDCVEGWTGDECETPPPACEPNPCGEFGTCTEDGAGGFSCACDDRFSGDLCDACMAPYTDFTTDCRACEAGLYGTDCTLTCASTTSTPWWSADWANRIPVIVTAPVTETSPGGATASFTFDHAAIVAGGGSQGGGDVRVLAVNPTDGSQTEVPRILAVDSDWNLPDTTIWWPLQGDLTANAATVFMVYYDNPIAGRPPNNPAMVLPPSRGWARTNTGEVLYAARRLPTNVSSVPVTTVHVRQTDFDSFEILVTDESDDGGSTTMVTVADMANNTIFDSGVIGDLTGTVGAPNVRLLTFDSASPSLVIQATVTDNNGSRFIFGETPEPRGPGSQTVTRVFSRSAPIGPNPEVGETCIIQPRP